MTKLLFKIGISSLLLFYIVYKIDWHVVGNAFAQINIFFYIISTIIALVCPVFLAIKYHLLIKNTPLALPVPRLIVINYISRFYALFLPSALGPEAVRWYKVTKNKQGKSFFLASTIFERLIFLLILLLFGTIPLFLNSENVQIALLRQRITPLLSISFLFLTAGLVFFFVPELKNKFLQLIKNRFPVLKNSKIDRFLVDFEIKQNLYSIFGPILALSLLWQFFFLARMFFLFLSLNLPLTFMDVTWMGSLVLLLQVLPVSFAGIGIREGAYAYLFTLFDMAPEKGILIGVLFFTQMLIFAIIGAFLNISEK